MKFTYIKTIIFCLAFFALAYVGVCAETNQSVVEQVKQQAAQTVQTNLNQVLIEMLSGVKVASGEVYSASKEAIHKSVDFIAEQAPDVIKQFLRWKFAEACVWLLVTILGVCLTLYIAKKIWKWGDDNDDDAKIMAWIIRIAACVVLIGSLAHNGMRMVKIGVAPKVYVIEYVVDTLKGNQTR